MTKGIVLVNQSIEDLKRISRRNQEEGNAKQT